MPDRCPLCLIVDYVKLILLQVVTGSHDSTIRLWDLAAGKTKAVLTNHKKSVRSIALHPSE